MTFDLTRRQLYDLVWSHQMPQVAAHLGLPEWEVKQICELHRVPLPKSVFWRDKAAGRRAKQAIFTSTADSSLELITFKPTRASEPLPAWEPPPAPVVKPAAPKREPVARVRVEPVEWQKVEHPHPLLAATVRALRSAKPDQHGGVAIGGEHIPVMLLAQASVERAIFILDDLIGRLTVDGISCRLSRQQFTLARGQDDVGFKFSEKIARVPHEPTLSELQAEARRLQKGGSNFDWYWNKAYPEFDFVPTGALRLAV